MSSIAPYKVKQVFVWFPTRLYNQSYEYKWKWLVWANVVIIVDEWVSWA
jgi:hypothetical protein